MRVVNVCVSPTRGTRVASKALKGSLSGHFFCMDLAQAGRDFKTVALASDDVGCDFRALLQRTCSDSCRRAPPSIRLSDNLPAAELTRLTWEN